MPESVCIIGILVTTIFRDKQRFLLAFFREFPYGVIIDFQLFVLLGITYPTDFIDIWFIYIHREMTEQCSIHCPDDKFKPCQRNIYFKNAYGQTRTHDNTIATAASTTAVQPGGSFTNFGSYQIEFCTNPIKIRKFQYILL